MLPLPSVDIKTYPNKNPKSLMYLVTGTRKTEMENAAHCHFEVRFNPLWGLIGNLSSFLHKSFLPEDLHFYWSRY